MNPKKYKLGTMKFINYFGLVLIGTLLITSCGSKKIKIKTEKKFAPTSELDTVSYCLGISIGENIKKQGVKEINTEAFLTAIEQIFATDTILLNEEEADSILQKYFKKLHVQRIKDNLKKSNEFLAANKEKEGIVELKSGLQYQIIKKGNGRKPDIEDRVTTHYKGQLLDGTIFDSSYDQGNPATFQVSRVMKGWAEALQLMKEGAKWRLFIPPKLAYGEKGAGSKVPPNHVLIFDVELIKIEEQKN